MKIHIFLLLFMMICSVSCKIIQPAADNKVERGQSSQPLKEAAPASVDFSEQSTWLLGYFTRDRLMREPYSSWFTKGYEEYQADSQAVGILGELAKDDITVKIVMGTWCPDSRREVPRFMKILDIWKFPEVNVTFIGVDNAKLSPVGGYEKFDIQRVPTFIIYKNNIEAGRIIENPVTSLEQDMVNILKKE